METLRIEDLHLVEELDSKEMAGVVGGGRKSGEGQRADWDFVAPITTVIGWDLLEAAVVTVGGKPGKK